MSKPQKSTPVVQIISLLKALPDWYKEHAAALADGLDDSLDAKAELAARTKALDASQALFERERKEDVAASIDLDMLLASGATLLGSISKVAQAVLRDHPQRARLTRQIVEDAPSDHRSAAAMIGALKLASAGLTQHAALFATRQRLHKRMIKGADALIKQLEAADALRKAERVETRAAGSARDLELSVAFKLIVALDDAAQAVYFDDPAPYDTLRTLYSVHCPAPPSRSSEAEDDASEDEAPSIEAE